MKDDLIEQLATPRATPDRARNARLITSGITLAALVIGGTTLTTGAVFTDTARSTDNPFTTGTVNIAINPATSIILNPNLAPGDTVTSPVLVQNSGSLEFRYSLADVASNTDGLDLASQLHLSVYVVPSSASCTKAGTDALTPLGTRTPVSVTGEQLFGDPTQGQQAGDRVLAANASETLCLRVDLPLDTTNAYQGAATSLSFTFDAEQTANNP